MKSTFKTLSVTMAGVVCLILLMGATSPAQKLPKSIYIQAQAMGTATQMGRTYGITLIIQELSTDAERTGLLEAFQQKGNEGIVNALSKMQSKGRMQITGTLGYDVSYVKTCPQPDGSTRLRIVTYRPRRFGEVWADTRSSDYILSGVE